MKISGPGESSLLLLKIVKLLNKLNISYAVVGAFAASFYGLVRASLDADAVISVGQNEQRFNQLLSSFKKAALKVKIRRGDFQDPIRCVINIEDKFQNRVDLLIGIRGMKQDAFHRVKKTSFLHVSIKIISMEDFIAMKIFAGSAKDIQDAIGVLSVSGQKIDLNFLKKLTAQYGKDCTQILHTILKAPPSY